jgi:hypothetical protein
MKSSSVASGTFSLLRKPDAYTRRGAKGGREEAVRTADGGRQKDQAEGEREGKKATVEPKADAKAEAPAETKADAPKNYSRGEGQQAVTRAYKDNWNAIFGKKKKR